MSNYMKLTTYKIKRQLRSTESPSHVIAVEARISDRVTVTTTPVLIDPPFLRKTIKKLLELIKKSKE